MSANTSAPENQEQQRPPQTPTSPFPPTPPLNSEIPPPPTRTTTTLRFWGIFVALCLLSFICALDVIIITTALPTITSSIGGASQYVWIANSFVVASAVLQPFFGQLADVLGRRAPLIGSVVLFVVGSAVAGAATGSGMLIAGRTVQGVGAGGLYVLLDIVCCDLVPLRERGKYVGLMNAWAGVAAALGPVLGGAIAQANWRWIFYLNIPISGIALIAVLLFMRMNKGRVEIQGVPIYKRFDYGNFLFVPSVLAVLLGLIMGGIEHPWSSWQVILLLVLGGVGWIVFHIQQHFSPYPSVPLRLFANRTSAVGYALTFLSSVVVQAIGYFLPVYFQAVLGVSVLDSGVYYLPFAIGTLFFAICGGVALSVVGRYKMIHALAFALASVGVGLLALLDASTSKVSWAFFQLIGSAGLGMTVSSILPAIMAGLPEADVATSTAAYCFVKTFGYVWGVTIASVIFNDAINENLHFVSDAELRSQLQNGGAYAFASEVYGLVKTGQLSAEGWREVQRVYVNSLQPIWWASLGFCLVGFCLVWMEMDRELRNELDTEYGLEGRGGKESASDGIEMAEELVTKPKTSQ